MTKTWQECLRAGLKGLYFPVAAILAAVVLSSIVMAILGFDPLYAYQCLLKGAFGNTNSIGETLVKTTPLIFAAVAFALPMRCGIFNLGATGQLYIGAILGSLVGVRFAGMPAVLHIPLMLLAGFAGGALYGVFAGWLRHRFGANELISTIMLNHVAIQLLAYCVAGPLKDPATAATSTPQSAQMVASVKLPVILPGTRLHAGLILAVLCLVFYYVFLWKTTRGYEMRVVGLNPGAGEYAGMSVRKNQLLAMLLAGGIAGIGGCVELMSVQSRLIQQFAGNIGFDGVAVALLGGNSPVGIALAGILFGALSAGAGRMQMLAKVPNATVYITQGLIILFVVGRELFRIRSRRKNKPSSRTAGPRSMEKEAV